LLQDVEARKLADFKRQMVSSDCYSPQAALADTARCFSQHFTAECKDEGCVAQIVGRTTF